MSRENVEVVRRLYAELAQATRDGELPELATRPALATLLHPDVELHGTIGGLSEGDVARGPEGLAKFMADDGQEWDEVVFEPQELIDVEDRVVVLQRERRRGRHSGLELAADTAAVLWLRDGLVRRAVGYMDQAEALAAAGLPPRASRG